MDQFPHDDVPEYLDRELLHEALRRDARLALAADLVDSGMVSLEEAGESLVGETWMDDAL